MADIIQMTPRLGAPGDSAPRPVLLIVDDDSTWRQLAREICEQSLSEENVRVLEADSIPAALDILANHAVHGVILDKNLGEDSEDPNHNGIASIPRLLFVQDHLQIVMATSSEDSEDIVQAILSGACSYVVKHKKMEYFEAAIKRALVTGLRLYLAKNGAESQADEPRSLSIPGTSPATVQLRLRIHEAAKTEAPIVIQGETGTGKSIAAMIVHGLRTQYLGKKSSDRPFIQINMGAISKELAESELFGHEDGSFTGVKGRRFGALERARGGTLFLDEIGEAPLSLQVKLLTALDNKKFCRVGGENEVKSEFRLICATNRNLEQMVQEGKFREDLYRRIAILEIKMPSVKERKQDIPEIVKAVLPKCCKEAQVHVDFADIPKDFIEKLSENPPSANIGGIEQRLIRLLAHAPRDRHDRPILKQWRSIAELKLHSGQVIDLPTRPITVDEIKARTLDIVGKPGFSSVSGFLDFLEKKLYEDARRKYGDDYGSNRKIAQAFALTDGVVSRKLAFFGMVRPPRARKEQKKGELSHEHSAEH